MHPDTTMTTLFAPRLARSAAAIGLAFASLAAQADVGSFSRTGSFAFDAEVHSFALDLASASDLRLWTTSWAGGGADPVLAFFDRSSGALLSLSDDVDAPYALVDASQGALDAGIRLTDLAAGQYLVAVSLSPNLPAGASWAEGYLGGIGGGNPVSSGWTVQVALRNAAPIPEPTPTALLLAGLAGLALLARGRRAG
jgi:hypothetical protein